MVVVGGGGGAVFEETNVLGKRFIKRGKEVKNKNYKLMVLFFENLLVYILFVSMSHE